MKEPHQLVEHLFRHEFGRIVAVLTRSLGVRRLALVEDIAQASLVQALEIWPRRGVPEDPAAWLYRTARNLAIDSLRREQVHTKALLHLADDAAYDLFPLETHFADEIGDEPLRMLFVCCHQDLPVESRVAMALRTLCGFSTAEIARALLATEANIQKRIERARNQLSDLDVKFDTPPTVQLEARIEAVLAVVYLLFSQGCYVTHGDVPIRRDMCDEARRLARMLDAHSIGHIPAVHALLALMCFHASRFDTRVDPTGALVLLEEQDRSAWNWDDISEGMSWLEKSATGNQLSRYHVEAGIAWEHSRAPTFAETDWQRIADLYDTLNLISPSPLHSLNRAVAEAYLHGPQAGLDHLATVSLQSVSARYPSWHTVIGEFHFRLGQYANAQRAWQEALRLTTGQFDRDYLSQRLALCQSVGDASTPG